MLVPINLKDLDDIEKFFNRAAELFRFDLDINAVATLTMSDDIAIPKEHFARVVKQFINCETFQINIFLSNDITESAFQQVSERKYQFWLFTISTLLVRLFFRN